MLLNSVAVSLLGGRNGGCLVIFGPVEEQVQQHGAEGGQQNAGLDQRAGRAASTA